MKPKPQEVVLPDTHPNNKPKQCFGSCVSGLFALFCDDIDENAFCPGDGTCCLNGSNDNKVSVATTMRPTTPVSCYNCLKINIIWDRVWFIRGG